MSELFEDEEKELVSEDEFVEANEIIVEHQDKQSLDARRRLENLLDEKRLKDELDDFLDY